MSSYFDAKSREVAEAADLPNGEFLEKVYEIENELFDDVTWITGDREFPDDLRERARRIQVVKGVVGAGPGCNQKAITRVLAYRSSRAIEDMHDLFHVVAGRRVSTRFGVLSDHPAFDAIRRDEHDNEESRE